MENYLRIHPGRSMKTILITTILLLIINVAHGSDKPVAKSVFATRLKLADISNQFSFPAKIHPKIHSTILSESAGVVDKLFVGLGDKVNKSQRIVVVKNTDPVYQYRPLTLKSTIAGRIAQVHVTEGSYVTKGQKILSVVDPNQMSVRVEISLRELTYFKVGDEGELALVKNRPKIKVRIKGISPYVDPATGTATAELEAVETGGGKLFLGHIGEVTFQTNKRKGFLLTEEAIRYRGKKTYVQMIKEKKAANVFIELGPKSRGMVEINEGLKEGELVITRASGFIGEGDEVKIEKIDGKKVEVKVKAEGKKL